MALFGTALALKRFGSRRPAPGTALRPSVRASDLAPPPGPWRPFEASSRAGGSEVPGVSILKPVKGLDRGLEECLESFFRLDYPRFELLFCAADAEDAAIPVVRSLIARYPRVRARLEVGSTEVGLNPKINNMARSYALARYDWILVSDSNVRAEPSDLARLASEFRDDAGVLTSAVAGLEPRSIGGRIEAQFLNGCYARWMLLAEWAGQPVVVGKCMLFRRSQAERFGGLSALGRYLAEDYMAGKAMALLGLRAPISSCPARQPIGRLSFESFWARHLRWGRIRRSQAPMGHALELLGAALPSGLLGAVAASRLFGVSVPIFLASHLAVWMALDAIQGRALGARFGLKDGLAWIARELLCPLLWTHAALGNTVEWRGKRFRLGRGGLLLEPSPGLRLRGRRRSRAESAI